MIFGIGPDAVVLGLFVEFCSCGFRRLIRFGHSKAVGVTPWMSNTVLLDYVIEQLVDEWPKE